MSLSTAMRASNSASESCSFGGHSSHMRRTGVSCLSSKLISYSTVGRMAASGPQPTALQVVRSRVGVGVAVGVRVWVGVGDGGIGVTVGVGPLVGLNVGVRVLVGLGSRAGGTVAVTRLTVAVSITSGLCDSTVSTSEAATGVDSNASTEASQGV